MSWTPRQREMLAAMGLRIWTSDAAAPVVESDVSTLAGTSDRAAPAGATLRVSDSVGVLDAPGPAVREALPGHAGVSGRPPLSAAPAAARGGVTIERAGDRPPTVSPVATLDWPALREAVAGCRACGLCETRSRTVFGVGHPQAHWMVVGEAPGEQEDRQGEPFVGPAGQLLDRMLAALGLSRADDAGAPAQRVFIANTLKCRPPRNRNPSPDEMQRCEPFLTRQIELVGPRIILAMGAFAVKSLLRTEQPVGRLRGQVHRYHGVPLVVTYHPAYLLRSLHDKAKAWDDLCLAAQVVEQAVEQDRRQPV